MVKRNKTTGHRLSSEAI